MDQGILESMKRRYRKKILREILYQDDADLVSCLKKIGMLKVAHNISKSWDEVEVSTLQKAWNNILRPNSEAEVAEPLSNLEVKDFVRAFDSLNINVTSSDAEAWFQGDGPRYEHLNDQGIIKLVTAAGDDNNHLISKAMRKMKILMKFTKFQFCQMRKQWSVLTKS